MSTGCATNTTPTYSVRFSISTNLHVEYAAGVFDHGFLEGAWFIATGNLLPLSEQQLVDCDPVDSAGNGVFMDGFAFDEQSTTCTETSYCYTATKGTCKASG